MVFVGCSTMRHMRLKTFSSTWNCQFQPRLRTKECVQHLNSTLQLHIGVRADHWHVHLGRNALIVHCKAIPKPASLSASQGGFAALAGCLYWAFETGVLNL